MEAFITSRACLFLYLAAVYQLLFPEPIHYKPNQQRAEGAGYGQLKAYTREQILVLIVLVLILSWIGSTYNLYRTAAVAVIRCGCTSSIHVAQARVRLLVPRFICSKQIQVLLMLLLRSIRYYSYSYTYE